MPHIILTAESSSGRDVVMLAQRVPVRVPEHSHATDQLAKRIAWAGADAAKLERPDRELAPRLRFIAGAR
jgi:hypothetical protein